MISRAINVLKKRNAQQTINRIKGTLYPKRECISYQPFRLTVHTIDRCTIRCNFCIRNADDPSAYEEHHLPGKDMTFETFKRIIDRFPTVASVCLAGLGEPMLNKDIFRMVDYAEGKQMSTSIVTNGTILDKVMDKIFNSKLSTLSVSLNSHNHREYAQFSGAPEDMFDKVIKNIKEVVRRKDKAGKGPVIRITYVCTKSNLKYLQEVVSLVDSLNVDFLDFLNLIPYGECGSSKEDCLYGDDDKVQDVLSGIRTPHSNLVINLPVLLSRQPKKLCRKYFEMIHTDMFGNIGGCGRAISPNRKFGNIFENDDVWNTEEIKNMRRMFLDDFQPLLDCCKTCVDNSDYPQKVIRKT